MATLEELLVSIGINTDDLTAGADGAADQVESSLGGIQTAAAGAAVGGLFMAGLTSAMDLQQVETRLQNQLGLTEAEAARAGDAAGRVYSAGFGQGTADVGDAVGAVIANIKGMRTASDADLDQMTKSALALADTYEYDVGDSTQAVGNLIKSGLVKDGTEGMDLLAKAAQQMPTALRAELPETISEYSEFFNQLGFTGPQMMGLFAQAAKDPTFQLDKLQDALKEFTLRMADTKAASEPLKELGLDVGHIQKLVNTGHGTKAFDEITAALRDVDDQTERTRLQAALFGGPGEDMGNTLANLSIEGAAAATGMDDAAGAAKGMSDNIEASKSVEAIWRTMSTTLGEMLQPALQFLADFFQEHPGLVKVLAGALLALAAAIGLAVIAQWAWNTALWAFPGTWIIAGILALIVIVVLIVQYWDEIKAATAAAWNWIKGKLSDVWNWIKSVAASTWQWVSDKTAAAWGWIKGKVAAGVSAVKGVIDTLRSIPGKVSGFFGKIVDYVAGLPGRISRAASGMWNGLLSGFKGVINRIIGGWNNLSFTIGGGSIMGVDIPSITLHTPNIPYLAQGGVTTGPTFAMIGEGTEQEAVLPLSKLDGMLRSVAGAVRNTSGSQDVNLRVEVAGPREFKTLIRSVVASGSRGGDVQGFFGTE